MKCPRELGHFEMGRSLLGELQRARWKACQSCALRSNNHIIRRFAKSHTGNCLVFAAVAMPAKKVSSYFIVKVDNIGGRHASVEIRPPFLLAHRHWKLGVSWALFHHAFSNYLVASRILQTMIPVPCKTTFCVIIVRRLGQSRASKHGTNLLLLLRKPTTLPACDASHSSNVFTHPTSQS